MGNKSSFQSENNEDELEDSDDQLLFPPEICEKIGRLLSIRDQLVACEVCQDWNYFLKSMNRLSKDTFITIEETDEPLLEMEQFPMRVLWENYVFKNIEFGRRSQMFWTLNGESITSIDFFNCTFPPHLLNEEKNEAGHNGFHIGCPNLKHIGLNKCDKYLMMAMQNFHLHKLLDLKCLKSLDVSQNNYLSDCILFSFLEKIEQLESLNISNTNMSFAPAIHKRFYPEAAWEKLKNDELEYSANVLTFQTLLHAFLLKPKGSKMKEIDFSGTRINDEALRNISNKESFKWESLKLNNCLEFKIRCLLDVLKEQENLTRLELGSSRLLTRDQLSQIDLSRMKHLNLADCALLAGEVFFLNSAKHLTHLDCNGTGMFIQDFNGVSNLNYLSVRRNAPIPNQILNVRGIPHVMFFGVLRLKNLSHLDIGNCGFAVDDPFLQLIIQMLQCLKTLFLCGSRITDSGTAGVMTNCDAAANLPNGLPISNIKGLKMLSLSKCTDLSERTWESLQFSNLSYLDLSEVYVSIRGLKSIINGCRNLEILNLTRSNREFLCGEETFENIKAQLPRMRKLVLSASC